MTGRSGCRETTGDGFGAGIVSVTITFGFVGTVRGLARLSENLRVKLPKTIEIPTVERNIIGLKRRVAKGLGFNGGHDDRYLKIPTFAQQLSSVLEKFMQYTTNRYGIRYLSCSLT